MDPGSRRKTQEKFVLLEGPFPSQTHTCVQYFDESRLSFLFSQKGLWLCGFWPRTTLNSNRGALQAHLPDRNTEHTIRDEAPALWNETFALKSRLFFFFLPPCSSYSSCLEHRATQPSPTPGSKRPHSSSCSNRFFRPVCSAEGRREITPVSAHVCPD